MLQQQWSGRSPPEQDVGLLRHPVDAAVGVERSELAHQVVGHAGLMPDLWITLRKLGRGTSNCHAPILAASIADLVRRQIPLMTAANPMKQARKPYDEPEVVEVAWAAETGQRLQGIVHGTTVGIPNSAVREAFGL
ncbi:MAG: hypothetical protein L0H25_00585 [Micrococcales bacterium]|nr:hypothetical protein [Micrococcales bacterium]